MPSQLVAAKASCEGPLRRRGQRQEHRREATFAVSTPRQGRNMTISLVSRWTTSDIAAATATTGRAKAFWKKHGVQDVRLSQIFTGPHTGQFIVTMVYADMPTYAAVQAAGHADPEFQEIIAQIRQDGSLLQEREILIGIDLP
jgi:hypothetical protein